MDDVVVVTNTLTLSTKVQVVVKVINEISSNAKSFPMSTKFLS